MKTATSDFKASASGHTPLQITATVTDDTAYITIEGYIYKYAEVTSGSLRKDVAKYKADGAKKTEVYVNTEGGSCFEATEIANIIDNAFGEPNVKVVVGALAASAGTVFTSRFYSVARKNTQFMIHKPMGVFSGNEDKIKRELKALTNLTNEYTEMYSKKTGKSKADIKAILDKGDYWMTAQEALDDGFIDEVLDQDADIDAQSILQLQACGAPIVPTATTKETIKPKTKTREMDSKLLAAKIGLSENATDEQINAKLAALNVAETENAILKTQRENAEKAEKAANIKALLDGAEQNKQITADNRIQFEALATADFENTKTIIASLPKIAALSGNIKPKSKGGSSLNASQVDWTYQDYQEKDPEAYLALEQSDPEKATAIMEAYYTE